MMKMLKEYFPALAERQRLRQLIKRKNSERSSHLANLRGRLNPNLDPHKKILSMEWNSLLKGLQKADIPVHSVLEAYTAKTVEATAMYNSVTEFHHRAETCAKQMDATNPKSSGFFARIQTFAHPKVERPPLYGVPFCVSDEISIRGMDQTNQAKRLYDSAEHDAVVIKILQDLGAIPLCKTNVCQATVLNYGSDNPVFGQTKNPNNVKLSPGGTNSGLGSLVAANGCLFGVGSDVGGTLRIPAHFNGVFGIMATCGRMSLRGINSSLPDLLGVGNSPGVIAKSPFIASAVFRLLLIENRQNNYDANVTPIPWDEQEFSSKRKLRIGYFASLPFFPPIGDTVETVEQLKAALEDLGHTLIPFPMPDSYAIMRVAAKFLFADHFQNFKALWKDERIADSSALLWIQSKIPSFVQKRVRRKMLGSKKYERTRYFIGRGATSADHILDALGEKQALCQKIMEEWQSRGLDALICPVFPFPAPPMDNPPLVPVAILYTLVWSLVHFPAGVVPVGSESGKHIHLYDDQDDFALQVAKKGIKSSIGAPIGVQIVALPHKEETILRLMNDLGRKR